jgi:hypothetical protein
MTGGTGRIAGLLLILALLAPVLEGGTNRPRTVRDAAHVT